MKISHNKIRWVAFLLTVLAWIFIGYRCAHASQAYAPVATTTPPGLTGLALATGGNANWDALLSTNVGTAAPSYQETGSLWTDSTDSEFKFYDGTQNEPIGFYDATSGNFSLPVFRIANAASTGTTLNKIAKLTGAPSTAVIIGTTDTGSMMGIVESGAGTTGNTHIVMGGENLCVFDGATTAGDYVQASTTTAGDCHDAGSTYPTSGQILGRVLSTNGGGGTYRLAIYPSEIRGSSGGGSGTITSSTTGTIPVYTASTTVAGGANFTISAGALTLGVSGTAGSVKMGNASTGTITLQPVTGTLGTVTVSLPAATDTLMGKATTDTMTNKTYDTAGTGNSFSINSVAVTANTGTGAVARASSPTFVTPALGAATATSINGNTFTTGTYTLTGTAGKTLTFNNTMTFAGTDSTTMTFPSSNGTIAAINLNQTWTAAPRTTLQTPTISTATFTPNFDTGSDFTIGLTSACPCTLANPSTTPVAGQHGVIYVVQDGTGSRTVTTWGSDYFIAGGTAAITLSTAASAIDAFSYAVKDSTHVVLSGPVLNVTH